MGFYSQVDEKNFKQPDMGEYYDEALIEEFLNTVDSEDINKTAYYMEEPFTMQLGYHAEQQAFVIKATPLIPSNDNKYKKTGFRNDDLNFYDGDTMAFNINSILDGGLPFTINNKQYKNFKQFAHANLTYEEYEKSTFLLRTVGIDAPEICHYTLIPIVDKAEIINEKISIAKLKKYKYDKTKIRQDDEEIEFLKLSDDFCAEIVNKYKDYPYSSGISNNSLFDELFNNASEIVRKEEENLILEWYKIVTKDEQTESQIEDGFNIGIECKKMYSDLLSKAEDMRIVIDANTLINKGMADGPLNFADYDVSSISSLNEYIKNLWYSLFGTGIYKWLSYNGFGQDAYGRWLGLVYIKTKINGESIWINTAKYIKAKFDKHVKLMLGSNPLDFENSNGLSNAFKLWTFDRNKMIYADAFLKLSEEDLDDRIKIQSKLTGYNMDTLKEYTVMIGDTLFIVPPTSIRIINQTQSERVSLLRSKGSMTKQKPHNDRMIEMTLYFNNEQGINGIPYEETMPNGKKITYHMNGLRSLISMFKFTPFLPIENKYINDTLNIDAVSLVNIQMQTMPNYPKCIAVNLTLQQFRYRVYMNDLPIPNPEKGESFNKNMFSSTINYKVMRYYYQRSLLNGESLIDSNPLSNDYIQKTLGNKTNLIPMQFKENNIEFYILDENWLKEMLEVKQAAAKRPLNQIAPITEPVTKWAKAVSISMAEILRYMKNKVFYMKYQFGYIDYGNYEQKIQLREINNSLLNICPNLIKIEYLSKPIGVNRPNGEKKEKLGLEFKFVLGELITEAEFNNLVRAIYKQLNLKQDSYEAFENGILRVPFIKIEDEDSSKIVPKCTIDTQSDSYKIMKFFESRGGYSDGENVDPNISDWEDFTQNTQEETLEDIKDNAIDTETLLSAKFILYPIEKLIPQQIAISMGNTFTNTKLKAHEGYAPQYAGGQDTIIEFTFQTLDENAVTYLNSLQEIAARQLINYRKVINCWPIRINSEITKLCGINEVLIESVDIATVPSYPGLYNITCRMISVDRTMRNKESLKRLDAINNSGAVNKSGITGQNYKTYMDLNNTLAKAELYPDLELPSLTEMEKIGYKFIRYSKNKNNRLYPDPDFYFVYAHIYSSSIFKKMIKEYFTKNADGVSPIVAESFELCDDKSRQSLDVSLTGNQDELFTCKYKNEQLKKIYEEELKKTEDEIVASRRETAKTIEAIRQSEIVYEEYQKINEDIIENMPIHWDICDKIKCTIGNNVSNYTSSEEMKDKLEDIKTKILEIINVALDEPIPEYEDIGLLLEHECTGKGIFNKSRLYEDTFERSAGHWNKIYKALGIEIPKKSELEKIHWAAMISQSSNIEYYKGCDSKESESKAVIQIHTKVGIDNHSYAPYSLIKDENTDETFIATTYDQALISGTTFGRYQIRKYPKEFLSKFYNKELPFSDYDFLDPYYNSTLNSELTIDEIKTYKTKIITSPAYSVAAFDRIVLVWTKKLIEMDLYLNFLDINRDEYKMQYENIKKELEAETSWSNTGNYVGAGATSPRESASYNSNNNRLYEDGNTVDFTDRETMKTQANALNISQMVKPILEEGSDMAKLLGDYEKVVSLGKIFLPLTVACVHGDPYILSSLEERNIQTLNEKTRDAVNINEPSEITEIGEKYFRKLIRALHKTRLVNNTSEIGTVSNSSLDTAMLDRVQKLWVKSAEDPSIWVMHSFYDMIVNDKRGRMARAFPTYYLMIIDEGREIGYWKLHDNFYNMSAIAEIEVVKSRKIPADTAKIVLTNMYRTFGEDDEDLKTDYYHNVSDVFRNLLNPYEQFQIEESERLNQNNINRIRLKPGARIHLRMGYGGDAGSLPILFNGVIAEVGTGELIEIIAQGDGHELSNPGVFSGATAEDAAKLENEDEIAVAKWISNFFNDGNTPKELIKNILTTKSTWFQGILRTFTDGRLFNDNMFGVVHFGSIDDKSIHMNGEVMQNIYEGEGSMPWTKSTINSVSELHAMPDPPMFTIDLADKSVWDILNICAGTSLDYITSIATFGIRSTIYFGRNHYYYAYDYDINDVGRMVERRKPFQQYHLIDSYSDIIQNNIKADGTDLRTCAVPIYKGPNAMNVITEKRLTSPLWIDFDIYPEFQKTITVNTGITFRGNKLGAIIFNKYQDEWADNGGAKIAWRMGAKALKDSVKDMYKGEVISIGDPVIKPYDKVYIHDVYENMNGAFEVEAVVHRLNTDTGFTSSIYPDCISSIDNKYEQIGSMMAYKLLGELSALKTIQYITNQLFETQLKVTLKTIANMMNATSKYSVIAINKAANLVLKDDLIKYTVAEKWSEKFRETIGISTGEFNLWNATNNLNSYKDILISYDTKTLNSIDDYYKILRSNIDTLEKVDLNQVDKSIKDLFTDGSKVPDKYKDSYDALINTIDNNKIKINNDLDSTLKELIKTVSGKSYGNPSITEDDLKVIKEIEEIYNSKSKLDLQDSKKILSKLESISSISSDLYEDTKFTKTILKHNDDIRDVLKVTAKAFDAKDIKKVFSLTKFAGGPVGAIIGFIIELVVEYVLTKTVYNWIENKMASLNVLQIYPLKKDSVPYIAGLDGHKGLVVGSPSYNQKGMIDSFFDYMFSGTGVMGILGPLLFSENMYAIYETYKKDNNLGDFNEDASQSNDVMASLMQTLTENQISNYSGYKSIISAKRLDNLASDSAKYTFNKIKVCTDGTIDGLQTNYTVINELVPITKENEMIKPLFEAGIIKTLHGLEDIKDESANELNKYKTNTLEFSTSSCGNIKTNGIIISDKNSKYEIIDIPFLRPDAYKVLIKILTEVSTRTDPNEKEKYTIRLLSATTVNDNRWNATGYMFTIYGKDCNFLKDILNDLVTEFKNLYLSKNDNSEMNLMQYKDRGNYKYEIFIAPRNEQMQKNFV